MKKINLYLDGNYFYKLWRFLTYEHLPFQYILNWERFKNFIKLIIAENSGAELDDLIIEKASLFLSKEQGIIYEDVFFSNLTDANIDYFYCSETSLNNSENLFSQITSATVWQACKNYYKDPYDFVVLLSGYESYIPMIDGLRREGVKSLIIYLDDITPTTSPLLKKGDWILDLEYIFNEHKNEEIKSIFARRILDKNESDSLRLKAGIPLEKQKNSTKAELTTKVGNSVYISFDQLKTAINNTRVERNGFVLVALLKISLEKSIGTKISGKMKNILNQYNNELEFTYKPAFGVKLKSKKLSC